MYLHYNYTLITLQSSSTIGLELINQLYKMNNQLIIVINCDTLKIKLEKSHANAKIILGDLSDQKSTDSIINKCRSIFPIIELLIHIELITDKFEDAETRLNIQTNFLELARCLLSTLNNTHRTALILLKMKQLIELDSNSTVQNVNYMDKDNISTFVSTLSDKNIQIIPVSIQNDESTDYASKTVSKVLNDLGHDRYKNENKDSKIQVKGKMTQFKNIFFSKKD